MITQTALDSAIVAIAVKEIELADKAMILRKQGDHDARRREHHCMVLRTVYKCLNYYDVASDLLTEAEIDAMLDTASKIIETI